MHPGTLFNASGKLAMAGWALLVFAPRWRWSQRIASVIIPLTLAIVYLVLIVVYFAKSPGGFGTLGQVTQLRIPGSCSPDGYTTWLLTYFWARGRHGRLSALGFPTF
jgi:Domain of unknown function (DUF4281)